MSKTILYGEPTSQEWTNITVTSPANMSGYTPAGIVVEKVKRGLIAPPAAGATLHAQKVTRYQTETEPGPGLGFGTLTETTTYYRTGAAEVEEDEQPPTAGGVGLSSKQAAVSVQVTPVSKSILLHPKVLPTMQNGGDRARALKMLAQGASPKDWMRNSSGQLLRIEQLLGSGQEVNLVMASDSYLDVTVKYTRSYQVSSDSVSASDISFSIKSPPGVGKIGTRDWLYLGTSYSNSGGVIMATETYMLSDEGGWSSDIY